MATFNDSLYVNFLTGQDTVSPKMEQLIKYGDVLAKKQALGGNIGKQMNMLNKEYGKNSEAMKIVNGAMADSNQKLETMGKRFNMNTLSWMFGGMALQRVGLMMTRFLIPSMDKLEKLNTKGAKQVMGMGTAFEFLKISMFETLSNTGLFDNFVQAIIKGAIWIAEFAQKHPLILEIAASLGVIATVLGTLAMGTGIFMQLEHLLKLIGVNSSGKSTGGGVLGGLNLLQAAGIAIVVAAELKLVWDLFANEQTLWDRIKSVLGITLGGAIIGLLLGGGIAGALTVGALALTIGITLNVIDWLVESDALNKIHTALKAPGKMLHDMIYGSADKNQEKIIMDGSAARAFEDMSTAQDELSDTTKMATDVQIQQYAYLFADQLRSETKTKELIKNTELFGETVDTVFGDKENGVIGKFTAFGAQIQLDNEYFTKLRDDIEAWASKVTTKTIKIKYVYEGKKDSSSKDEGYSGWQSSVTD